MDVTFELHNRDAITNVMLDEAARLFSTQYGIWGPNSTQPGQRVRLSSARLRRDYLQAPESFLVRALVNSEWVGHALGKRFDTPDGRRGIWITQLVVHAGFRNMSIARRLISTCYDSRVDICGMVTSHPYAVFALEKATGAFVVREDVIREAELICRSSGVRYLQQPVFSFDGGKTTIVTNFFVDHDDVLRILQSEKGWKLGTIADGEEFVAITFPPNRRLQRKQVLAREVARIRALSAPTPGGQDSGTFQELLLRGLLILLLWCLDRVEKNT
eukprot:c41278_g1_i1.p1 GENE.c41278_g1_i1~~c41278_g1_i1.p1  ORF type:complete len:287 (+),score=21.28 c41278_g1_i1:45-863(+)